MTSRLMLYRLKICYTEALLLAALAFKETTAVGLTMTVAVHGAGFGGLATALELAQRGARVVLCESLNYPGGCASTFRRDGYAFEAGATLFSGLAEEQLFGRWGQQHGLGVEVDWIDPLVELRMPSLRLSVYRDRQRFMEQLYALPGAPVEGLRRFFAVQRQVADALWTLFDNPRLLPPLDLQALLSHATRAPRYMPLLRWLPPANGPHQAASCC